jgi:XTP/dITP diphosphohydrolase
MTMASGSRAPLRLVLASNNAGKLAELRVLFAPLALELVPQPSLGLAEAEEPHATFVENALAKARHAARAGGAAALADDSGLCVDALGGAPGVVSAHYASVVLPAGAREAQRKVQDAANNRLLLQRLDNATDRRASFVCTLVALRSADDPQPLIATGRWPGEILVAARGTGGFGYDPLMHIPALGATVAELTREQKNAHSHRAQACAQMLQLMRDSWQLAPA